MLKPVTIDFETSGIQKRPFYPPMPVGVSIQYWWDRKPKYYAFGHLTGNNSSWQEAKEALQAAYKNPDGILCQNAKFDVDVAEHWFGLPIPDWDKIHDTMFLLFLDDPHQIELALKPASVRLLGMAPEEQDAVAEWLVARQPIPNYKISASPKSDKTFAAFINCAPGDLVADYANGDVIRTKRLFKHLYPSIVKRGMLEAYQREQQLMPILLEVERQGLAVDLKKLRSDTLELRQWMDKINQWVLKRLKAKPDLNLDSGPQIMAAMIEAGSVDESKLELTPTGKYKTSKDALLKGVTDKVLLAVLTYRSQLKTCLNTFMSPWLEVAEASGGFIYATWNQVKSPGGDGSVGARTGRLSSTPNFQNMPNAFKAHFAHEQKGLPRLPKVLQGLPPLPQIRSYVIPFKNEMFVDRDYSQQEPRILGHFEGGRLLETYERDPWVDVHDKAQAELAAVGKHYERKPVKNTNLGLIYGMGAPSLAIRNDMGVDESKALKAAVLALYPGLKAMQRDMKILAKLDEPIYTWGAREYYCEPPKIIGHRIKTFEYKMINVLVQGSAADCTKEAIIRFHEVKKPEWKMVLFVHDQITVSVPKRDFREAMEVLRQCMEGIEFDVPMLTEGAISRTNWAELQDYDKKGKRV